MKESRKWYFARQICCIVESITMFIGGVFVGTADYMSAGILLATSIIMHFIEHEVHFRSIRALMGEEVEEHHKAIK